MIKQNDKVAKNPLNLLRARQKYETHHKLSNNQSSYHDLKTVNEELWKSWNMFGNKRFNRISLLAF